MRKVLSVAVVLVLTTALAPAAWAADDGNTQPKLSYGYTQYAGDYYEIVATTSGTGNVKGVHCTNTVPVNILVYVNGGSAQTLNVNGFGANNDSGWIPMNVRFTSSIRVRMERPSFPTGFDEAQCAVSWAFD